MAEVFGVLESFLRRFFLRDCVLDADDGLSVFRAIKTVVQDKPA
jgi:hypothetical protein